MVERLFSDIATKKIKPGVCKSVNTLEADVMKYLKKHNENPKVYIYTRTKDADTILGKVAKCKGLLGTGHWEYLVLEDSKLL